MTSAKLENITRFAARIHEEKSSWRRGLQNRCVPCCSRKGRWAAAQRGRKTTPRSTVSPRPAAGALNSGSRDLNSRYSEPVREIRLAGRPVQPVPRLQLRDSTDYVFKSQLIGVLQTLQQQVSAARGWATSTSEAATAAAAAAAVDAGSCCRSTALTTRRRSEEVARGPCLDSADILSWWTTCWSAAGGDVRGWATLQQITY